jgi:Domain of unknown function (DUF4340)
MKFHGLIAAVVVLIALGGVLYWSNHRKPTPTPQASADLSPRILTLNEADIVKIDIKRKSGDQLALARDNAGKWELTAPEPLRADQDAVSSLVTALSSVSSDRVIEDKATNLNQYGLNAPSLEVDVAVKNNKTHKLLVGDNTPTSSNAYAMLAGDPRVFTLATFTKNDLDKSVNDLRDKRLLTVQPDKVSRLELLVAKKPEIEFGRIQDAWQILKPRPLRADSEQVGELVRKLNEAKMDVNAAADSTKKVSSGFSSAMPVATAKLTDASGTQELQVRKNKDDYYAKSSVVEGVYKVSSDLGKSLDKGLDDFRNKKLFDFGFNDPNKIEMHDGPKSYVLTRSGEDWSSNGKKMDRGTVETLVNYLRDMSASKFVDSGFTTPTIDVTVSTNDGKHVERVLISKQADKYVAKRENEPGLYELDAKSVEDVQKSAGDMKPAEPAKK